MELGIVDRIREQVDGQLVRMTAHAQAEMVAEGIRLDEVFEAIATCSVMEDYPEHRRSACCLVGGLTAQNRSLHIVCTTAQPMLIVITVYEPKPPKWPTPQERRVGP